MNTFPWELLVVLPDQSKNCLFVDEAFPVEISVHRNGVTVEEASIDVALSAKFADEREANEKNLEVYSIHEKNPTVPLQEIKNKTLRLLKGTAKCVVILRDRSLLRLCATGLIPEDDGSVLRSFSSYLVLYRYKLFVKDQPEKMFYKDVGGKSKHMTATVEMQDMKTDSSPNSQSLVIPLNVELVYSEDNDNAPNQILTIKQDSDLTVSIIKAAIIHFRIEEVSKNHRGNKFKLRIVPNSTSVRQKRDVAPCFTNPIQVFSKRKKLDGTKPDTTGDQPQLQLQPRKRRAIAEEEHDTYEASSQESSVQETLSMMNIQPESPPLSLTSISLSAHTLIDWVKKTLKVLTELKESTYIGSLANCHGCPESKVYGCASCQNFPDFNNVLFEHKADCSLALLINDYEKSGSYALKEIAQYIDESIAIQMNNINGINGYPVESFIKPIKMDMSISKGKRATKDLSAVRVDLGSQRVLSSGPPLCNRDEKPDMAQPASRLRTLDSWTSGMIVDEEDEAEKKILYVDLIEIRPEQLGRNGYEICAWCTFDSSGQLIGLYVERSSQDKVTMGFKKIVSNMDLQDLNIRESMKYLENDFQDKQLRKSRDIYMIPSESHDRLLFLQTLYGRTYRSSRQEGWII